MHKHAETKWLRNNASFIVDALEILEPYAPLNMAASLLYRYRSVAPAPCRVPQDDDVLSIVNERWEHVPNRPGWVNIRKRGNTNVTRSEDTSPNEPLQPALHPETLGASWNNVAVGNGIQQKRNEVDDDVEAIENEDESEELYESYIPSTPLTVGSTYDEDELYNNDLLMQLTENLRAVAFRHNCCYGVHAPNFMVELGNLVGV